MTESGSGTHSYVRDCVIYLRRSKGKASISRQRRQAELRASELNWRIVAEFPDADTTAWTHISVPAPAEREKYLKMIAWLESYDGPVPPGVLSQDAERLHREVVQAKQFVRLCAARRIPVETVLAGGYDLTKAHDRKRFMQDAVNAEGEVDIMSERRRNDKLDKALQGHWLGGPVPFGWTVEFAGVGEPLCLVLVPAEAAAIKKACEDLISGTAGLNAIAREWNAAGFRSGKKASDRQRLWDHGSVATALKRPRNAGFQKFRGEIIVTDLDNGKGVWDPIVDDDTWRTVIHILASPERRQGPGPKPKYLGTGLYVCGFELDGGVLVLEDGVGRCGATVSAKPGGGSSGLRLDGTKYRRTSYRCSASHAHVTRNVATLDAFVEAVLVERMSRPDVRSALARIEAVDLGPFHGRLKVQEQKLLEWEQMASDPEAPSEPITIARGAATARAEIAKITKEMNAARRSASPLISEILVADDFKALWMLHENDLEWRRRAISTFATVVVLRQKQRGRPPGTPVGDSYFHPDAVRFDWKPLGGRPAPA